MTSPATLLAKKRYCRENKIDWNSNISILATPWKKLTLKANPLIKNPKEKEWGKKLAQQYKMRYDKWMGEYKKWARDFAIRRGRRLITRV